MSVERWTLYTPSGRHIGDVAKVVSPLATLASGANVSSRASVVGLLANVSVRWLAHVLLATAALFNEGLTLWCAFALCLIKCRLYCLFLFTVKKQSKEAILC